MKILIILGHPEAGSFNHAIAKTCIESLKKINHEVIFHDLYAENFDPVLHKQEIPTDGLVDSKIQAYCDELKIADGIIIIHPNWWGQPPAILKGWVDRVIRPNVAYKFCEGDAGEGIPIGLLKYRVAIVLNTSNTKYEREQTIFGDPLQHIWEDCIFNLCGVNTFYRKMFETIISSSENQRNEWLKDVKSIIDKYFT